MTTMDTKDSYVSLLPTFRESCHESCVSHKSVVVEINTDSRVSGPEVRGDTRSFPLEGLVLSPGCPVSSDVSGGVFRVPTKGVEEGVRGHGPTDESRHGAPL